MYVMYVTQGGNILLSNVCAIKLNVLLIINQVANNKHTVTLLIVIVFKLLLSPNSSWPERGT